MFGPSTFRDATGFGVQAYLSPIGYIPRWAVRDVLRAAAYVDARAEALEAQGLVEKAALDPYTFIRRSYLQRREYQVYDGNPPKRDDDD